MAYARQIAKSRGYEIEDTQDGPWYWGQEEKEESEEPGMAEEYAEDTQEDGWQDPGEEGEYAQLSWDEYGNQAVPDESFIARWENYLANENLEEEFAAYREARSRFFGLVDGPVAAEWMRQSATWLMAEAMRMDQLMSFPFRSHSPALSHDEEVQESTSEEEEPWAQVPWLEKTPGEAEEYSEDQVLEVPDEDTEEAEDERALQRSFSQGYWPEEAEEYLEVSSEEEDEEPEPAEASQYRRPGEAYQYADLPPLPGAEAFNAGGRTIDAQAEVSPWERQVSEARKRLDTFKTIQSQQQALWDSRPGVPMDTGPGRVRVRSGGVPTTAPKVCFQCFQKGHVRSLCPNPVQPRLRAKPSPIQGLRLQASRLRGRNPRNGDNVTDVPRGSVKHVRFSGEAAIQDLRERAEKILAIRESEELAEEAVRLGRMVSSDAPLY